MSRLLHVVNGGSTLESLRAGGVTEAAVSWDDVLHEGPLDSPDDPGKFRKARARHLAAEGWVDAADVLETLERRDLAFDRGAREGALLLWFEHDLYDQLQLLQIFHRLRTLGIPPTRTRLLCIDRFPGIEPFHGLGQLHPKQLAPLGDQSIPVEPETVDAAWELWRAICAPEPTGWVGASAQAVRGMPFLHAALGRWAEEFPSAESGLSRTEAQILRSLDAGPASLKEMFRMQQKIEPAPFLGDWSFVKIVRELVDADPALLAFADRGERWPSTRRPPNRDLWNRTLQLTPLGRSVMLGERDRIRCCGFDRWLGGVHLKHGGTIWRYHADEGCVQRSET